MMILYPAISNPSQTRILSISSKLIPQQYQLFISLPEEYERSDKRFPVLYLLDGNSSFTLVKPIVELQQFAQKVPQLILVGVGYPVETYMDTVALRGRDLTFIELTAEQKAETEYPYQETGKASLFFDFLVQELIPFIEREYRTDPNERALAGFSMSATFVLYTMFQKPLAFPRMISISPSFHHIFPVEEEFAREYRSLPLKMFMGIEAPADDAVASQRVEGARQFIEQVGKRPYEGLETIFHVFDDIDHASAGTIGFTHALRQIYL